MEEEEKDQLKIKLKQTKIKLNNFESNDLLKYQLLEYISKLIDSSNILSEEIVIDVIEKINNYIQLKSQNTKNKKENEIAWPDFYMEKPTIKIDKIIKLEILIWYSKIIKELRNIDSDINNNLVKSLIKIEENNQLIKLIFNAYSNCKISNISTKSKKIIYGSLNAFFIFKLYKNNINISFLFEIQDFLNNMKNRKENDNYFIYKVYDYLKILDDNFTLYIPKFKKY